MMWDRLLELLYVAVSCVAATGLIVLGTVAVAALTWKLMDMLYDIGLFR